MEAADGMVVEKAWTMMREASTASLREGSGKSADDEGGLHAVLTRRKDAAVGVGRTRS